MSEQRRDRFEVDEAARDLARVFRDAQTVIVAQVRAALATGNLARARDRRLALAAVVATLDRLGAEVTPLARDIVRDAVRQGADQAARDLTRLPAGPPDPVVFFSVSQEAVDTLTSQILGRMDLAIRTVGRTVEDVYAKAGRRAALRAVLGADGSPQAARRQLVQDLLRDRDVRRLVRQDGVTGFVDRAGKRWALDTYAEMVVRTTTREAVVQGSLARMAAHGINLARVSRHASSCDVCKPWEGALVSLDGQTTAFQGEAVASLGALPNSGPPFHPRCRHTLQPVASRIEALRRELQGTA